MKKAKRAYRKAFDIMTPEEHACIEKAVAAMTHSAVDSYDERVLRAKVEFSKCKGHCEGTLDEYIHAMSKAAKGDDYRLNYLQEYTSAMAVVRECLKSQRCLQ